jgi:putative ABC transport system substrate-binding protein
MAYDENDPRYKRIVPAFTQALADLGRTVGRNLRMDLRSAGTDVNRIRALAQELVGLQPDIILTNAPSTGAVQRETRTIPIVFLGATDPVAAGIVPRLNQPGGNITGLATLEATLGGKWLELLSEIAPGLKRVAIMFNPDTVSASVFMFLRQTAKDCGAVDRARALVRNSQPSADCAGENSSLRGNSSGPPAPPLTVEGGRRKSVNSWI